MKCKRCGLEIIGNSKTYNKNKYHIKCYEEIIKEEYEKENSEKDVKKKVVDLVLSLFEIDELTFLLKNQLQEVTDYNKVFNILNYAIKHSDIKFDLKYGIGIVPYLEKEYEDYLKDLKIIENKNINKTVNNKVNKIYFKDNRNDSFFNKRMIKGDDF